MVKPSVAWTSFLLIMQTVYGTEESSSRQLTMLISWRSGRRNDMLAKDLGEQEDPQKS